MANVKHRTPDYNTLRPSSVMSCTSMWRTRSRHGIERSASAIALELVWCVITPTNTRDQLDNQQHSLSLLIHCFSSCSQGFPVYATTIDVKLYNNNRMWSVAYDDTKGYSLVHGWFKMPTRVCGRPCLTLRLDIWWTTITLVYLLVWWCDWGEALRV